MITINDITKKQAKQYKKIIKEFDKESINILNAMYQEDINNYKKEKYYTSYLNIVSRTTNLLKELKLDSPLYSPKTFEYLLWNGYF